MVHYTATNHHIMKDCCKFLQEISTIKIILITISHIYIYMRVWRGRKCLLKRFRMNDTSVVLGTVLIFPYLVF